jgi:hypothetical protein
MGINLKQENLMRWILFYIFVILFVVIVLVTLAVLIFGIGNLLESERNKLFNVFLVEIGFAVVALFYSIFNIKNKGEIEERKIRLSLGELGDVRKLVGKEAVLAPSKLDGTSLPEQRKRILDDNGPYLPLDLPKDTYYVYITVDAVEETYTASFVAGTYLVNLSKMDG